MSNLLNTKKKYDHFKTLKVMLYFFILHQKEKLIQIETYLPTKSMMLIIIRAGKFPQFFQMP